MNSEQISLHVDNFISNGGKIQKLPDDNTRFFFPVCEDREDLLDKFAYKLYEDEEMMFDILD